MELKVGQTIYAIKLSKSQLGKEALIIGQSYKVIGINKSQGIFFIDNLVDKGNMFRLIEFAEYFTNEPPKKERYFIVFFNGDSNRGTSDVIIENGEYVNRKFIKDHLITHLKDESIAVTNIIELSKTDYESWNK